MSSLFAQNINLHLLRLDGIEYRDLHFENGERYVGGWKNNKPEGEGCYTWADGSCYEGSWHTGVKQGWGTYYWPNGAVYQGEWSGGLMQGFGTFESPDGSRYQGGWSANLKHGLGRKQYGNGDSYEGLWRAGKAEGPGRYVWAVGNQYDGEWRGGRMHGQGTLKWKSGERYDGEWAEGQENGIGVFTWRDGSTYEGFWAAGRKQGVGVFRPTPNRAQPGTGGQLGELLMSQHSSEEAGAGGAGPVVPTSPHDVPVDSPSARQAMQHRDELQPDAAVLRGRAGAATSNLIFICDYEEGRLVHEEVLSAADVEAIFGPPKDAARQQAERRRQLPRKARRRRDERMGETIYKGHRSYDLMLNLQLGIRYTITAGSKLPPVEPPASEEASRQEKLWLRFPREGSEITPPHPSTDFKWKDYCPTAFRALRQLFGIDNGEYILSVCGDQALRELPSPGKSGSVFFLSHDDKFVIKTMRKEEIKLLLAMVPRYLEHVRANPNTLLVRFFGVHRVKPSHGNKVRFVVMNNLFRTEAEMHRKFDLKGSTLGRTAGPRPASSTVLKDLDLDTSFHMDPSWRQAVVTQLQSDLAFLEAMHVMDYSLLLGVHYKGDGYASHMDATDREDAGDEGEGGAAASDDGSNRGQESPRAGAGDSLQPAASSSSSSDASPTRRRSSRVADAGGKVGGSDSAELEVLRSMHSLAIERVSPTKLVERSRSSFGLRGWTWRQKQQQQVVPAPLEAGRTVLPPTSAQVTPRQQPSLRPTPRGGKSAPLASRLGMAPQAAAAAPQAAAAAPQPAGRARSIGALGARPAPSTADLPLGTARSRSNLWQQQQQNGSLEPVPAAATSKPAAPAAPLPRGVATTSQDTPAEAVAAAGAAAASMQPASSIPRNDSDGTLPRSDVASLDEGRSGSLISWRSDAVQLPELALAELTLASPHSPHDATTPTGAITAAAAATQGGSSRADEPVLSARPSARQSGAVVLEAIREEDGEGAGREEGSPLLPLPPAMAAQCTARPGDSPSPSPTAAVADAVANALGMGRRLPLPEGVPRINMPGWPEDPPEPASSGATWQEYVDSLTDSQAAEQAGSSREASGTPVSVRSKTPAAGTQHPGQQADAAAAGGAASPPSQRSPAVTSRTRSMPATRLEVLAAEAAEGKGGSPASAPATFRRGPSPAGSAGAVAGGSAAATTPRHLARSTSDPIAANAAALQQQLQQGEAAHAATSDARPTSLTLAHRREASVADLSSPEVSAMASRVSRTLSRPVHDPLVQGLLRLARYRMLGQLPAPARAGARALRTATTVLAARHVRHAAALTTAGSAEEEGGAALGISPPSLPMAASPSHAAAAAAAAQQQEAQSPHHPHQASGRSAGVADPGGASGATGAAAAKPQCLGYAMPALAVSRQEPRQADEVLLFFGVIDFLQEYNMRKKLEHGIKSVTADRRAISVVDPRTYARRFISFMEANVFVPAGQQQQQQQQQT